jgi:hypothetical protein
MLKLALILLALVGLSAAAPSTPVVSDQSFVIFVIFIGVFIAFV